MQAERGSILPVVESQPSHDRRRIRGIHLTAEPTRHRIGLGGRHIRLPRSRALRIGIGVGLLMMGTLGFLPILGFWMIPLGLVLAAQDVPFLQPPMARLLAWINRKWPAQQEGHRAPNGA